MIFKALKDLLQGLFMVPLALFVFSPFYIFGLFAYAFLFFLGLFYFPWSFRFRVYAKNVAIGIDQLANAFLFGNPDQTVSGRLGYLIHFKNKNNRFYVTICKILNIFFRQSNHCLESIEFDRINMESNWDKETSVLVSVFGFSLFAIVVFYWFGVFIGSQ